MAKVLLLPGDGIGPEVIRQAEKSIEVLRLAGCSIECESGLIGGVAVDSCGEPFPKETEALAKQADAVLLGAVGGISYDALPFEQRPERGLLALRSRFGFYANLRPAVCFPELSGHSPLRPEIVSGLDILIVRELTGGIYFAEPRGVERPKGGERRGFNTLAYTESEIRRILKIGFEMSVQRSRKLCSVDKFNVLECSVLWREIANEMAQEYPDVKLSHMLVDNAAMQLVRNPRQFDVIVTENMFGDILSDEASMLTGSIGLLPSASLAGDRKGLYEPVHGSAPDIMGKDLANPCATLLSLGMLLKYSLGEEELAGKLEDAVRATIREGFLTSDLAGNGKAYGTDRIGDQVAASLAASL